MNRADEFVAQIEAAQRELAGVAASSDEKLNEELRAVLEELKTVSHRGKRDEMKRRASRGFARYLVAICIGIVAGALAWQSYGEASKQIIAKRAPELGWSPEAKQMIAGWIQRLGWTKPPAGQQNTAVRSAVPETPQPAPIAQNAPEAVAPKTPTTSSIDLQKVQQMEMDIAAVRQTVEQHLAAMLETVEQLAAGQDQMEREIAKLQAADMEILARIPSPPAQPPAAPTSKPMPVRPLSSRPPLPLPRPAQ